jgi:ATP-dependent protease ClpP protease subunit
MGQPTNNFDEFLGNTTELSPATYQYYKQLNNRKIILNDEIDTDVVERVIIPLIEMDNDGTNKPIEIFINTIGGNVFYGFALVKTWEKYH